MLLSNSSPPFSFVSGITMSTTTGITPRDSLLLKPNPLSSISSLHCLQVSFIYFPHFRWERSRGQRGLLYPVFCPNLNWFNF
uniref:Uncharacterized protein n=1 Tax=Glycine max TaxID=3847 RepID=K7LVA0_SOYBN